MTPSRPLSPIVQHLAQMLQAELDAAQTDLNVYEMEQETHRIVGRLALQLSQELLDRQGDGWQGAERPCGCGGTQTYQHAHHPLTVQTSLGTLTVRQRASYRCAQCEQTEMPLDRRLGDDSQQGRVSRYLQERVDWLATFQAYGQVGATLALFDWPEVAASQVHAQVQALGQQVVDYLEERQAQVEAAPENAVRQPPEGKRLYMGVDGVMYCTRERDAAGQYQWRELKVATVYEASPDAEPTPTRAYLAATTVPPPIPLADAARQLSYVVHTGSWATFGPRVWAEGRERGVKTCLQDLVVVADGAEPIDTLVQDHLEEPGVQVTRILDLRHAQQPIWDVAKAAWPAPEREAWARPLLDALLRGQTEEVTQALHALATRPSTPSDVAHLALTTQAYFDRHARHTDYPAFVAQGYQIGSGLAESGCKRFGTDRMKGTGMRWSVSGASHLATLRAMVLSGRWGEVSALCSKHAA